MDNRAASMVTLSSFDVPVCTSPLPLSQQAFKLSTIAIGFLLNCIIFLVIVVSRQLHNPRHIFWAGVSLINQFYLTQCILEVAAIVYHDTIASAMYVLSAGVGYSALLLILSLAACDRYSAIAHYEWYKKRITNKVIILAIIGSFILTFLFITSPFWTGFKSIGSGTVNLTHMQFVLGWDLLLGIFSVILHVKIYIVSRLAIREYAPNLNQFPLTQRFNQENNPQSKSLTPLKEKKGFLT